MIMVVFQENGSMYYQKKYSIRIMVYLNTLQCNYFISHTVMPRIGFCTFNLAAEKMCILDLIDILRYLKMSFFHEPLDQNNKPNTKMYLIKLSTNACCYIK